MGASSLHPPPGPDTQIAFQGNRANSRAGHMHCRPSSVRTPACERGSEPCRRSGGASPTWAGPWEVCSLLIADCAPLVRGTRSPAS